MVEEIETLISKESAALVENRSGKSDLILVCEHAGKMLPEAVGSLGISKEVMETHIGWDIGAAALSRQLSRLLDSPLILQRYSRLVYDCNRSFDAIDAIVVHSDDVFIPGNAELNSDLRRQRFELVYEPFYESINAIVQERIAAGTSPVIITIHSFTPIYKGRERRIELGVLHDKDTRLADSLLSNAAKQSDYLAERNVPYSADDGVTHTIVTHGINNRLHNVMFEVRNDLIADEAGQTRWASRLASLITLALGDMSVEVINKNP